MASPTAPTRDAVSSRGRPRSPAADRAILEAAFEILGESGYAGLTMEGIAARAGVGKATLYRRWKSRGEVIAAGVADFVDDIAIPDTGSVEEDLLLLERRAVEVYRGRPGRVMPGLLAAMAADPGVAEAVRRGFLKQRRAALAAVIQRGVARGELREDVDVELVLDFLGGPLFYRLLVTGGPLDDHLARGVVATLLRGLAAAGDDDSEEDA